MKRIWQLLFLAYSPFFAGAQDVDLDKLLDQETKKEMKPQTEFTIATFKSSRIANGHSVETLPGGVLDVKISHRFGAINKGLYELFGLDNATIRIGADYGITDKLMVGLGRSSFEKQYDAFAKYKILQQSKGKKNMPVTLTAVGAIMYKTLKDPPDLNYTPYFTDRLFYTWQLLVARKFSENFSFQLMPTMVHYNVASTSAIPNDLFVLGAAFRQKITKRMSVNAEYYYNFPGSKLPGTKNTLSLGLDVETGGHVFQFVFTNSTGIAERPFLTETTGSWSNGDIHFGFNISRVFQLSKRK